ncbi:MAG TPA: TIGR02678 family protein [Thermoanaerobaculia bacterium]|nr:TIGR02678 family protein [Thermoanaerobaculia bacterium]
MTTLLDEEQRRAVRLLLAHPFVSDARPDPETFALVRRHARELQRWFAEQLGYRLVVDTEFARLHKRPAPGARLRPLRTQSNLPFDPRRYALLCLVLAALERVEVQTVLSELAGQVALLAASEEAVRGFDLESFAERQAFVDVIRWLVEQGVLSLADGEDTAFVEGRGDALYDLHSRRLSQLLSAPVPAAAPESLESTGLDVYPETEEGANRRVRHRLMRRLVEEPVLYIEDLEEAERSYLTSQRHYLLGQVSGQTGLAVEVRREGLAAVDPAGRLSDLAFPATGTLSHASLLLAGYLAETARAAPDPAAPVSHEDLRTCMEGLLERYGHLWSKRYRDDPAGVGRLLADSLELLEQMGLLSRGGGGVVALPAIARFGVTEPASKDETDG